MYSCNQHDDSDLGDSYLTVDSNGSRPNDRFYMTAGRMAALQHLEHACPDSVDVHIAEMRRMLDKSLTYSDVSSFSPVSYKI